MFLIELNKRLTRLLMIIAACWAFILCFVILADIIGKGIFNTPVYGVREIVMNSIVMIVFLQAGYAISSNSMLRADFIVTRFPKIYKKSFAIIGNALGALFFLLIFVGGIDMAIYSWVAGEYEGEGALRVPSWPTRFTILFGSSLAFINYIIMLFIEVNPNLSSQSSKKN